MTTANPDRPAQQGAPGPEAKPSEAGAKEPETLAASILPERLKDRARHPDPPEAKAFSALLDGDDVVSAAEEAAETGAASGDDDPG